MNIRQELENCVIKYPNLIFFFYNIFNKFVSYRIVISNSLKTYYNVNFGVKPTCILNTIIDHTRFDGVANQITTTKSLVYVGNCELKKDNVDNIIEAFKLLNAEYPDYILEIYGKPSKRDENYLKSISIGFENRILFKGRINYDQVPQVLFNSNILVTSQPDTVRAIGGFPTKLGEYLLTGKPSLFTIVGEINNYIIDCENGFLVEPNNPIQYFNKLKFIIENYEFSLDVAEKGKTYILSNFTSKTATIELAAFFQKV